MGTVMGDTACKKGKINQYRWHQLLMDGYDTVDTESFVRQYEAARDEKQSALHQVVSNWHDLPR